LHHVGDLFELNIKLRCQKVNVTCLSQTGKKAERYVVGGNFKRNEDDIFNFDFIIANVKS